MRIRLEKRLSPSRFMQLATPIVSVLLTMALGAIIFQLIGFDGPRAIYETFITPVVASYKWQDVATKAAPLISIAKCFILHSPFYSLSRLYQRRCT